MRSAVLLVIVIAMISLPSAVRAEKTARSRCKHVCEKSIKGELTAVEKQLLKGCTAGKFACAQPEGGDMCRTYSGRGCRIVY
jgi:hypothetical protein